MFSGGPCVCRPRPSYTKMSLRSKTHAIDYTRFRRMCPSFYAYRWSRNWSPQSKLETRPQSRQADRGQNLTLLTSGVRLASLVYGYWPVTAKSSYRIYIIRIIHHDQYVLGAASLQGSPVSGVRRHLKLCRVSPCAIRAHESRWVVVYCKFNAIILSLPMRINGFHSL